MVIGQQFMRVERQHSELAHTANTHSHERARAPELDGRKGFFVFLSERLDEMVPPGAAPAELIQISSRFIFVETYLTWSCRFHSSIFWRVQY